MKKTWRPLPRREFSVRDDYDVLIGTNRHIITPQGWVQEEHNLKVVLDQSSSIERVLARENGLARYERIEGFDWSPGDTYWRQTGPFWGVVREVWADYFGNNNRFKVIQTVNNVPLYAAMFGLADASSDEEFSATAARESIENVLAPYVTP